MIADAFDVAVSSRLPEGPRGAGAPHAFGFVYRQIMRDKVVPHVPIFINTFYPPNQPTAKRCFDFGRSLARAVTTWPTDATVALIASGGLSHFVINEDLDRNTIEAMQKRRDRQAGRHSRISVPIGSLGNQELDSRGGRDDGTRYENEPRRLRALLPFARRHRQRHGLRRLAIESDAPRG